MLLVQGGHFLTHKTLKETFTIPLEPGPYGNDFANFPWVQGLGVLGMAVPMLTIHTHSGLPLLPIVDNFYFKIKQANLNGIMFLKNLK